MRTLSSHHYALPLPTLTVDCGHIVDAHLTLCRATGQCVTVRCVLDAEGSRGAVLMMERALWAVRTGRC